MLRTSGKILATPLVSCSCLLKIPSLFDLANSKGLVLCHLVIGQ